MFDIGSAVQELNLPYDIEYAVINLKDDDIVRRQGDFASFLRKREKLGIITPLEMGDIYSRVYTKSIMPNSKFMIIMLFPYMTNLHDKRANLSVYTLGCDYHIYIKDYLRSMVNTLKSYDESASFYIQSDTGHLNERFFAFYSGIGMLGLNSMIFSKIYGSYVNIGIIMTDMELKEQRYVSSYCDKCMACVRACPGAAIRGDFTIDSRNCASYITQKKSELDPIEQDIIRKSGKVFGCDVCQNVCHFNHNVKTIPATYDIIDGIKYSDIADISNKKFKEKYKDRAFSFRGKGVILRNLKCLGEDIE